MHCRRRTNILHFSMNISNFAKETIYLLECLVAGRRGYLVAHTLLLRIMSNDAAKHPSGIFGNAWWELLRRRRRRRKNFFLLRMEYNCFIYSAQEKRSQEKITRINYASTMACLRPIFFLSPAFTLHVRMWVVHLGESPIIGVIGSD